MGTKAKIFAVVAALIVAAVGGYQYAAALYGEDIAALREDYATRAAALEAKYREKEKASTAALVAAWEERDRALSLAADLSGDLERVRADADAARRDLSRATEGPCDAYRKKLSECASVVERGAEVVARCVKFSSDTAADKDALANMLK